MAVAPSSAGNRFRQRKISTKQTLQIFKQSQISDIDNEDLQQRDLQEIETGVDKNEEDEVHLQKILKNTGISNTSDAYIPTPDASKVWPEAGKYYTGTFHEPDSYIKSSCQVEDYAGCLYNMDEDDEEFLTEFNKSLESDKIKIAPLTEDEFEIIFYEFEKIVTEKQPFLMTDPHQILQLNDIKVALLKVDKSSVDNINKVLAEELKVHPFISLFDAKLPTKPRSLDKLIDLYGDKVYDYYKEKKIARLGKTIAPTLKFTGEDDSDAYICFRQRQFRQQRKTRRADTQSSDKLIKLYQELKSTKELASLVAKRELKRLEAIQTEREIFELRCKVKVLKRELGITDSDEDLIAHKKKKIVPPPPPSSQPIEEDIIKDKKGLSKTGNNVNLPEKNKLQSAEELAGSDSPQQFQPYVKLPPSKIPDMELETVQHLLKNKDYSMQKFVEEKLKKRRQLDIGFTNFTDDPYNPYFDINIQNEKILDKSHTPYSSITSSFFDVQSLGYIRHLDRFINKGASSRENDGFLFNERTKSVSKKFTPEKYNPFSQDKVTTSEPIMTIRKRVGRLGQVYIDRKAMISKHELMGSDDNADVEMIDAQERLEDRWKFDSDYSIHDVTNEPFSNDPAKLNSISNETQVIRFGGMLLSKAYETLKESIMHQRQQVYYQQLQRIQAHQQQQQQLQQQGHQQVQDGTSNQSSPAPGPKQPQAGVQNSNQVNGVQNQMRSPTAINKLTNSNTNTNANAPIKSQN